MCLAPITLSTKSGHVQACRLVHGFYMANLTKCFDMTVLHCAAGLGYCWAGRKEGSFLEVASNVCIWTWEGG